MYHRNNQCKQICLLPQALSISGEKDKKDRIHMVIVNGMIAFPFNEVSGYVDDGINKITVLSTFQC